MNINRHREEIMSYIELKDVKKSIKWEKLILMPFQVLISLWKRRICNNRRCQRCWKSTILNILGGMDTPTSGEIIVDGCNISNYNSRQLTTYRRYDIGFVFQFYNLVQNLTVRENIEMATQICKNPLDIDEVIKAVGLEERKTNFPAQLSGGEQQRVAIARALAKNPKILLCDEPTGALDYNTGKSILKLLYDTCRERNVTVIVITHNLALTAMGDKVIKVKNGLISEIEINENPIPVERIEW